jgi:hypothetical protein
MFSLEQSFSTAQFELTAVLFNLTAISRSVVCRSHDRFSIGDRNGSISDLNISVASLA